MEANDVTEESAPWQVVVEAGKVREFAATMQCDPEPYAGAGAVTPPTFLITAANWAPRGTRVELGFDRRRVLHGEQEFVFHGPPPAVGAELIARERVVERGVRHGRRGGAMQVAVVSTEFRDASGTLVAEARATVIELPAASAS